MNESRSSAAVLESEEQQALSESLEENRKRIEEIFHQCDDILIDEFHFGADFEQTALVVLCSSLTQSLDRSLLKEALNSAILSPAVKDDEDSRETLHGVIRFFEQKGAAYKPYCMIEHYGNLANAVLSGQVIVLFESWNKAICFDAFSTERRPIDEPATEAVINGPREGTVEELDKNIALIRVRLKSPRLKIEFYQSGKDTRTRFLIGYMDGTVKSEVLGELKRRLKNAEQVDVLDTNYLRELVEDSVYSPFPQHRITERPDVAVSALIEGKIIMIADGSTSIMISPTMFAELFQSAEDYYQRPLISSLLRMLRIIAFFIALTLPSLYIALSDFHPELIPTTLLLTILNTREGIPFPAFVEAIVMQFFFELLREAGIRLPRPVGSAVSIVGALIIGEASIRAGIASPIMIVIISLTGIASFSLPQYELAVALRILMFPLMVLAFLWGGFGLMIGYILIFLHLATLRSLGMPFYSPVAPMRFAQLLDIFVRASVKARLKVAAKAKARSNQS